MGDAFRADATDVSIAREKLKEVRDLSDFCQFWPDLSCLVSDEILTGSNLDADAREMVRFLRQLCDRVSRIERLNDGIDC